MPFCEECAKYWAPSAMKDDGTCPSCGRQLEAPKTIDGKTLRELAGKEAKAPWHFKLLVVLLVLYLVWRVLAMTSVV